MYNRFKNLKKQEKGQGLVEYALILVLVAIVVIGALMILGPVIGNVFTKVNSSLSTVSAGNAETGGTTSPLTDEQTAVLNHVCGKYSGSTFTVDSSGSITSSNSGLKGGSESRIPAGSYNCP